MNKLFTFAAGVVGLWFQTTPASAFSVTVIPAGPVVFSGFSAEMAIDHVGSSSTLDVGDSIRSIFTLNRLNGVPTYGAGTANPELTGVSQVRVITKVSTATPALFDYTFGPDPASGLGPGNVAALYEDAGDDFTRICGTVAACDATARNGALPATFGMAGGFWDATIVEDLSVGAVLAPGSPLGAFAMALDFTLNNTGVVWGKANCTDPFTATVSSVDVCGTGTFDASGRNTTGPATPYDVFDPLELALYRIPEPRTLVIVGFGFLALGLSRRRSLAS
ncbi:MAG: hypothetical protein KDI45_13465 [Candidatus Accumulibacter sp.]|nr:hypothetical protein [Accumulibacter sp.]MCB1965036.1 hypothetical protein [Accumulibacter sp.]